MGGHSSPTSARGAHCSPGSTWRTVPSATHKPNIFFIPARKTALTLSASRHRIHCKALQRDGAGAGCGKATQSLATGVWQKMVFRRSEKGSGVRVAHRRTEAVKCFGKQKDRSCQAKTIEAGRFAAPLYSYIFEAPEAPRPVCFAKSGSKQNTSQATDGNPPRERSFSSLFPRRCMPLPKRKSGPFSPLSAFPKPSSITSKQRR